MTTATEGRGSQPPQSAPQERIHLCAGYGSGIYNSAKYYQQSGIGVGQYKQDLGNALSSAGASASSAGSGNRQFMIIQSAVVLTRRRSVAQSSTLHMNASCTQATDSVDCYSTRDYTSGTAVVVVLATVYSNQHTYHNIIAIH